MSALSAELKKVNEALKIIRRMILGRGIDIIPPCS